MKLNKFWVFFLLLLLMPVLASAQDVGTILTQFSGIIFIIVFVLILLAVGGVLHLPKVGMGATLGLVGILILIALVFIIPQFVPFPGWMKIIPESFMIYPLPEGAANALEMMGLPKEWMYVPAIIYLFILPFAGIYTLVWAFLITLGIFPQRNVNRVLALIITFLTIPMGAFINMVWVLFSFMGAWSIAVFAVTFIVGIFYRGAGVIRKRSVFYKSITAPLVEAEEFEKEADELIKKELPEPLQPEGMRQATFIKARLAGGIGNKASGLEELKRAIEAIKRAAKEKK